ncbi:hypothetical protein Salat_1708000 [Sesamum alatum]|uniref:Uncharacterized protein n=1 Tax=Sesamum alatum TaxID=300844 RepID=A0AAE1Y7J2_9LAMI|nr:hypothetical protein Salat_1708000 [Sesamum alatum]
MSFYGEPNYGRCQKARDVLCSLGRHSSLLLLSCGDFNTILFPRERDTTPEWQMRDFKNVLLEPFRSSSRQLGFERNVSLAQCHQYPIGLFGSLCRVDPVGSPTTAWG